MRPETPPAVGRRFFIGTPELSDVFNGRLPGPETIAAISTAVGRGGIAVVRLSGAEALAVAGRLLSRGAKSRRPLWAKEEPRSHRLYHGFVLEPQTDRLVDEVLVSYMAAPRSYTREDVVEINSHGGPAVCRRIMELVLECGARLARPGEFTLRAFLNGRIDLLQAEAVADLINAQTQRALDAQLAGLKGDGSAAIASIRETVARVLSHIEASLEFPEDVGDPPASRALAEDLRTRALDPAEALLRRSEAGRVLREGLTVTIAGRPNVGKSSLLNRLLGDERAIVTATPGTTRDTIEGGLEIAGMPIRVIDTAGIRESSDTVEQEGVRRAWEAIGRADLVLFVVDGSQEVCREDLSLWDRLAPQDPLLVLNKQDRWPSVPEVASTFARAFQTAGVGIAAKTGRGLEDLRNHMEARLVRHYGGDAGFLPNLRQKGELECVARHAGEAQRGLTRGGYLDAIALDLQESLRACDRLLGNSIPVDLLDAIFERFCIGK